MRTQRCRIWLTILLAAGVCVSGCATMPPAPQWKPLDAAALEQPLTLERCLQLARQNDIRVAQWNARLEVVHAELIGAKTLPNPAFAPAWDDIGLHEGGVNLGNVIYGVSYPIFFWWPRAQQIAVAQANRQVETEKIRSEQRQLAIAMATAYFGLVADQRRVKLVENLRQLADESLRLAQKKRELQIASDYEVQRVRAEQLRAQSDLLEAHSQLRANQLAFAFALGADRPVFPTVVDCGDEYVQSRENALESEVLPNRLREEALQSDPNWREKQAAVTAAEHQLQVEQRRAVPLADATGIFGPKDASEGWGSAFSLEVPIPLFDWNRAGIRKAQAELQNARAEEEGARRAVVAAASQAWERYRGLATQWNQYTKAITELAQKNEQAAVKLFGAGQIEYDGLLLAQRDSRQAQLEALAVWRDVSTAAWTLSLILGQGEVPPGPR